MLYIINIGTLAGGCTRMYTFSASERNLINNFLDSYDYEAIFIFVMSTRVRFFPMLSRVVV